MAVVILMEEGNMANVETDTAGVGLIAVLLQMSGGTTEVADANQRAVLDSVPLMSTPQALVTQLVRHPVPRTIDCLLDATDVSRVEGRCGWGKGGGDVVVEAAIGVRPGKAVCGLVEDKAIVCKLLLQLGDLSCPADDLCSRGTVADDFSVDGVVSFLSHSPVDAFGVGLVVSKEKLLPAVKSRARELIRMGMEVFGVDRATASLSPQQLGTGRVPVDHDEGGDLVTAVVRRDLEDVVDGGFLKVDAPPRTWVNARLWACQRWIHATCASMLRCTNALTICSKGGAASRGSAWRNWGGEDGMEGTGSVGIIGSQLGR